MRKAVFSIVITVIAVFSAVSLSYSAEIDTQTKYQKIEGFGAALGHFGGWVPAHPNKEDIYDSVFTDLDISILRIGNWYQTLGDYGGIKTDSQNVAAGKKRLGDKMKVLMCSWRIPAYLRQGGEDAVDNGSNTLKKDANGKFMYNEYGQWWKTAIEEYANRGNVYPDWISIQNEPGFNYGSTQSSLFSATENAGGYGNAGYGPALKAVYDHFQTLPENLRPKIIGPENEGVGWNAFNSYMSNLDTALLDGFAYHPYGQGNYEDPDKDLVRSSGGNCPAGGCLRDVSTKWPTKPHFMTEFDWGNCSDRDASGKCTGGYREEENMISLAWMITNYLNYGNLSAYISWTLVWPHNGKNEGSTVQIDNPFANRNEWLYPKGWRVMPEYHALRHFSKFVRPGAQRVKFEALPDSVRGSAFETKDGDSIVAVIVNIGHTAKPLAISGLDGYDVSGVIMSVQGAGQKKSSKEPNVLPAQLPARSIITVVWTSSNVEPDKDGYFFHHPFEDGTAQGWGARFGAGSVANTNQQKANGSRSLTVTGRTASYHGPTYTLNTRAFVSGNNYSFSVLAMYDEGPETASFKFTLQYDLNGETVYAVVDSTVAGRGAWVMLENDDFPIPAGAANPVLYVETPGNENGDIVFYIDDAMGGIAGAEAPGREGITPIYDTENARYSVSSLMTVRARTLMINGSPETAVRVKVVNLRGKTIANFNAKGGASLSLEKIPVGVYIIEAKRVNDGMKMMSRVLLR